MAALNITLAIADDVLAVATSQLAIAVIVTQDGEMRLDIRAAGAADDNSPVGIPIQTVVHASAGAGHAGGLPPAAMWPMSSSEAQPPRTDGTAAPSSDSDLLPTYSSSPAVAPPPYSPFRPQTTSNQPTAPMSNQPMHNTATTPAPAVPPAFPPGGTVAAPTPIGLGLVHRPQLPTPPPTPPTPTNPVLAPALVAAPPTHTHQQMTFPAQRRRRVPPPPTPTPAPLGEMLASALATLGAQLWPLQIKRPRAELDEMPGEDDQEDGRRAKRRRL